MTYEHVQYWSLENSVEFQANLSLLFKYFVTVYEKLTLPSLASLKLWVSDYLIAIIAFWSLSVAFHNGTCGCTNYVRAFSFPVCLFHSTNRVDCLAVANLNIS